MNKLMHNIAVAVLMVFAIALSSLVHAYNGSMSNSAASSSSTQITTDIEQAVDHSMHHAIDQSNGDNQSVSNHHADMMQSQDCHDCPPLHCQLMASAVLPTAHSFLKWRSFFTI
ncbi:MAG: hypothetical protein VX875_09895 [Pseudomonadota bacterium]|nr:hypothetical protein [Pseudomonadota bacterium]